MLQRHACQTTVLQALRPLGHMRSNNYSTTKIFVDNFLLSMSSIMSTNRCSHRVEQRLFKLKKNLHLA